MIVKTNQIRFDGEKSCFWIVLLNISVATFRVSKFHVTDFTVNCVDVEVFLGCLQFTEILDTIACVSVSGLGRTAMQIRGGRSRGVVKQVIFTSLCS